MFPEWTWIIGFWIGAAVGSFLNVVIYRLPRGLSIYKPAHSFCPNCKAQLTTLDLFPLLSWLFLGGKCRHCKAKVSSRYFWVELINGALWAVIWYQQLAAPDVLKFTGNELHVVISADPVRAVAYMLFASALVAAIFTDLAHYIIPDQINAFMLVVGLVMNGVMIAQHRAEAWTMGVPSAVAGALVGVVVLWGIAFLGRLFFRKDAMGHGDIKMARGIGAVLFPFLSLVSFGLAIVLGALIGIAIVLLRMLGKVKDSEDEEGAEGEEYEPESFGSLAQSGLGYVLCIDVIGLAAPRMYEAWFKENPYAVEELEEEPRVELTMIPFGPYLAAGALAAVLFAPQLTGLVNSYTQWVYRAA
ncbi:MAG: prepilin peptidase [Armatimonadetes bacterium]|nr:prepilin peptidase [Armatimonadota bacterium]